MSKNDGVRRRFKNGIDNLMKSHNTIISVLVTMGIAIAALAAYTIWFAAEGANLHGKPLTLSVLEVTDATILRNTVLLDADVTCTKPVSMGCIPSMDALTVGALNVTDTLTSNTTNLIGETTCNLAINPGCIPKDLVFDSIIVTNLTSYDFTHVNMMDLNETFINVETVNVVTALTCTNNDNVINQNCFDISNEQCPNGELGLACIPVIPTDKFADNSINGAVIVDNSITTLQIQDGTILGEDIAGSQINTTHIIDGTILGEDIAASQITTTHILDGTILAEDIAEGAVTTTQILDGTILGEDIAASQINTTHIIDGTILGADIAAGQITTTHILDGTILAEDIATGAVTTTEILDGTIATIDIGDSQVTDAKIAGMDVSKLICGVANKLSNDCLPANATFDMLTVNNLTTIDFTHVNMMEVNHTMFYAEHMTATDIVVTDSLTCTAGGAGIDNGCLSDITTNEIQDLTIIGGHSVIAAGGDIAYNTVYGSVGVAGAGNIKQGTISDADIWNGGAGTPGSISGAKLLADTIPAAKMSCDNDAARTDALGMYCIPLIEGDYDGEHPLPPAPQFTSMIAPGSIGHTDINDNAEIRGLQLYTGTVEVNKILGTQLYGLTSAASEPNELKKILGKQIYNGVLNTNKIAGTQLQDIGVTGAVGIPFTGKIAGDTISDWNIYKGPEEGTSGIFAGSISGDKILDTSMPADKLKCILGDPAFPKIDPSCYDAGSTATPFDSIAGGTNPMDSHIKQKTIVGGATPPLMTGSDVDGNVGIETITGGDLATPTAGGNIAGNTVTGYNIKDATITNADISASAAIAGSKISSIGIHQITGGIHIVKNYFQIYGLSATQNFKPSLLAASFNNIWADVVYQPPGQLENKLFTVATHTDAGSVLYRAVCDFTLLHSSLSVPLQFELGFGTRSSIFAGSIIGDDLTASPVNLEVFNTGNMPNTKHRISSVISVPNSYFVVLAIRGSNQDGTLIPAMSITAPKIELHRVV